MQRRWRTRLAIYGLCTVGLLSCKDPFEPDFKPTRPRVSGSGGDNGDVAIATGGSGGPSAGGGGAKGGSGGARMGSGGSGGGRGSGGTGGAGKDAGGLGKDAQGNADKPGNADALGRPDRPDSAPDRPGLDRGRDVNMDVGGQ